jgi:hypothetical protein
MTDLGMYDTGETKILAYKCQKCGNVYYPAGIDCRKCYARRNLATNAGWDTINLGGVCRLLSYNRVLKLTQGKTQQSLQFGMVENEIGFYTSGQLATGKPVNGIQSEEVVFESDNRPGKPAHILDFCLKKILGRYGGKT